MFTIEFSKRQKKIVEIVKKNEPITSEHIANILNLTRATLRPDLAILTMTGVLEARPKVGYFYLGKTKDDFMFSEISAMKVGEIKSIPIVVDEKTSVYDAIVTMFLEDVGTIMVTSEGYLTGVVSRKDFLKSTIGGIDIYKVPVGIIMTRMPNIITVSSDDSIIRAAKKIIEHEVDSLPIVEKESEENEELLKVIGRISKTNLTKIFLEMIDS